MMMTVSNKVSFFYDFPAEAQIFDIKDTAHKVIFERLTQDIFNATLANGKENFKFNRQNKLNEKDDLIKIENYYLNILIIRTYMHLS